MRAHATEEDVKQSIYWESLSLEDNDEETKKKLMKQRRNMLEKIRKEGNFRHNLQVIEKGKGILMPHRRVKEKNIDAASFIPCYYYCKTFIKRNLLWLHERRCNLKKRNQG